MIQTMILNDTVMNDYERVKKWREKNRARYNLYQRNRRKGLKTNPEYDNATHEDVSSDAMPPTPKSKIEELRELVKMEQEKPRVEAPMAVKRVYRSETGMVITKEQWEAREAEKSKARSKGFEIDEYAQT